MDKTTLPQLQNQLTVTGPETARGSFRQPGQDRRRNGSLANHFAANFMNIGSLDDMT